MGDEPAVVHEVLDIPALDETEMIGQQPAVAAPPDGLGAHTSTTTSRPAPATRAANAEALNVPWPTVQMVGMTFIVPIRMQPLALISPTPVLHCQARGIPSGDAVILESQGCLRQNRKVSP